MVKSMTGCWLVSTVEESYSWRLAVISDRYRYKSKAEWICCQSQIGFCSWWTPAICWVTSGASAAPTPKLYLMITHTVHMLSVVNVCQDVLHCCTVMEIVIGSLKWHKRPAVPSGELFHHNFFVNCFSGEVWGN